MRILIFPGSARSAFLHGRSVRADLLITLMAASLVPVAATDSWMEYVERGVWIQRDGMQFPADFGELLDRTDVVLTGSDGTAIISIGAT